MAEDSRPPVAIRITRPYDSEDEFLARELETLTRTSITLLGAQHRPQGVVLRFELALVSGTPLVRGEGRVTAYKEGVFEGLPGLTLRFTRLDSKSKTLVDRAAAIRDARTRPSMTPAAPSAAPAAKAGKKSVQPPPPLLSPSPPPAIVALSPAPPLASQPAVAMRRSSAPVAVPVPVAVPLPPIAPMVLDLEATLAEVPRAKTKSARPPPPAPTSPSRAIPPPPTEPRAAFDLEATHAEAPRAKSQRPPPLPQTPAPIEDTTRDGTLQRLRLRAKSLDPAKVDAILETGKSTRR